MIALRVLVAMLPVALLGGCVGSIGNGALPTGSGVPAGTKITISEVSPQLKNPLENALTNLGYGVAVNSNFTLDAAYSERPVTVSFESDDSLNSANAKLPSLGVCAHRIQRLSLVVTDAQSGRPVYQGQAELTQCAGLSDENATRLAHAAVAKMRSLPPLP